MQRPFVTIATEDQWLRCAHEGTALEEGVLSLAAIDDDQPGQEPVETQQVAAGLAFDDHCRLFHSIPEQGQIERLYWRLTDRLRPPVQAPETRDLFAPPSTAITGDFVSKSQPPHLDPRGLAVDERGLLWVADFSHRAVRVFDLASQRAVSVTVLPFPPLDFAALGDRMQVLTAGSLVEMTPFRTVVTQALPAEAAGSSRIAASSSSGLWLLTRAGTASARVVSLSHPAESFDEPFATDIEFEREDMLVVARSAGSTFLRYEIAGGNRAKLAPLLARGYDGRGIVLTPDGRIGFWTARGFRTAVFARRRYVSSGRLVTYRLDSGEFSSRWGRVFLDACLPAGTSISMYALVSDDPPPDAAISRTPPANMSSASVRRPDLSPPLPPASILPAENGTGQSFHQRETGREIAWAPAPPQPFETYEAPVIPLQDSPTGRYLWLVLQLAGNTTSSPRVQAIRAETPAHGLLRKLPAIYSREAAVESFLWRYLAPIEGQLGQLDATSESRHVILDPRSAPEEMLPWLGGFTGLVLDQRFPESARRTAIAESVWLFRYRGTIPGLTRFIEIFLGFAPRIIEQFRFRGHGGGSVGDASVSSSILGGGFRVGGAVGESGLSALEGLAAAADGFRTSAHRFTIFIPGWLTAEQLSVVRDLLEFHRPAHTLFELCTIAEGMRVGRGLYVELTTVVASSSGWRTLQLGAGSLGRDAIVGSPVRGFSIESQLGQSGRVG
jgi:phage tail-like protein